ncbi:MAG: HEAT repeat domain-containing protein [Planctomycetota bacterium]|jgi:type 1 glutamine amidotransferase
MKRWIKTAISILLIASCTNLFAAKPDELQKPSAEEIQQITKAVPRKATARPARRPRRKMLVFSLCNGFEHGSIPYWEKALVIMGQRTRAYEAVLSNDMEMFRPDNLEQFDAVCFNNNTKLGFGERPLLKQSLMDFIKGGKGIVGIHAATDNFYDWAEAAYMMGGRFAGHPWRRSGNWAIKLDDAGHPLMAAFKGKGFKINDEIYRTAPPFYSRSNQRVLMSLDLSDEATLKAKGLLPTDFDTGISWIKNVGKGRLFYCSLGHNNHLTWNPALLRHYLDGIQFALGDLKADATPIPADSTKPAVLNADQLLESLEESLAAITGYKFGQSRIHLINVSDMLTQLSSSPDSTAKAEKRLLDFLKSDATIDAKEFICRQLSLIGTKKSVPTLADMLKDPAVADMARYALERIPGSAVDKALRQALTKTTAKERIGIINTLGRRRDRKSVATIAKLIEEPDMETAIAAVNALGRIADSRAVKALAKAKNSTKGELRLRVLDAYLGCAESFADSGSVKKARTIYEQLYESSEPDAIRAAALKGLVLTSGEEAKDILIDAIKTCDPVIQAAAIPLTSRIPGAEMTKYLAESFAGLSVTGQIQVCSELANRGDKTALEAVVKATMARDASVRIAALKALGRLGGASNVMFLAETAASGEADEAQAARESLYSLTDPKVNQAILSSVTYVDPPAKVELIACMRERDIKSAVPTLLIMAKDADSKVSKESIKALAELAAPDHLPQLIEILINIQSEALRQNAEKTVVAIARKMTASEKRVDAILAAMPLAKDVTSKSSLLSVLGKIGEVKALPVLRSALADADPELQKAAIKALSEWPDDAPADDLLKIAETSGNKTNQVLALRGFVRLIGLKSGRSEEETIKMYKRAMNLAPSANEKKMILAELANVKTLSALDMAAEYLDEAELQQEAAAAVIKMADDMMLKQPQRTRVLLQKVLQVIESDSLKKQAQEILEKIK